MPRSFALVAIGLLLATLAARAVVPIGHMNAFNSLPLRTNVADSRYQFVLTLEELQEGYMTFGSITSVSLYLVSATAGSSSYMTLRMGRTTETSYTGNTYLTPESGVWYTMIDSLLLEGADLVGGAWNNFDFDGMQYLSFSSNDGYGLLVDICMDQLSTGPGAMVGCETSDSPCAMYQSANLPGGNLLESSGGTSISSKPIVRFEDMYRMLPDEITLEDSPLYVNWSFFAISGSVIPVDPGVEIIFGPCGSLNSVSTQLSFNGTSQDSIFLRAEDTDEGWLGLTLSSAHMSYVDVSGSRAPLQLNYGSVISHCRLHHNSASPVLSMDVRISNVTLTQSRMDHNEGTLLNCHSTGTQYGARLDHVLFHDNLATDADQPMLEHNGGLNEVMFCTFARNTGYTNQLQASSSGSLLVSHSVLADDATQLVCYGDLPRFEYCRVIQDYSDSDGSWASSCHQIGSAGFRDAADGDFGLLPESPLVDAGAPTVYDPDLTVADLGAFFYDQRGPQFAYLLDVPQDQGRQVLLGWHANSVDRIQGPAGDHYYSVWRQESVPAARASVFANREAALRYQQEHPEALVSVADRTSWWTCMGQVPTRVTDIYGLVVATQLDNTPITYQVCYHEPDLVVEGATGQASSADNVAPDAPTDVRVIQSAGFGLLAWNPVTTGTASDGARLPELNGVSYSVYHHATDPWFAPEEGTLLTTTTLPYYPIAIPSGPGRGFYRVVASDQ